MLQAETYTRHKIVCCKKSRGFKRGMGRATYKCAMALQTGAGIGVDYFEVRPNGSPIRRTGGVTSGPLALMDMVNNVGRGVAGGSSRSAVGLALVACRRF